MGVDEIEMDIPFVIKADDCRASEDRISGSVRVL